MEVHPDSALLLLNQIPHPENLHGKQSADYALLLTQARDKNFLDSLQSDSLIKIAVDYYQDSDDKIKAGKVLFYYGKVMALQDNDTIAMQAYLKAQTKLEKSKEYKIQGLIQEFVGHINNCRGMHGIALDHYRKSVYYYQKARDTLGLVYNYRNIACIFDTRQENDSVKRYIESSMLLLKGDSLSPIFPSLLQLLGEQERRNGNFIKAILYFQSAIKIELVQNSIKHYYFSLGDIYMQMGQLDKAEECFKQGVVSDNVFTKAGAYNYLYLLEKRKADYTKALYYKEQSDSLLAIEQDENLKTIILTLQRRYETDKLQMDKKLLEQENQKQLYLGISITASIIILSIIFYLGIKKRYLLMYRRHLKIHAEKALKIVKENERIIGQYICEIDELKQREILAAKIAEQQMDDLKQRINDIENRNDESAKEQIVKLNQKIQILISENKTIREDSCAGGIYILEQLKKGILIVENMTQKEKNHVFEYIDLLFGDFVSRVRAEYHLNENNLILAVLVKLGFTSVELMIAFQCEKNSILKKKQRLKDKLNLGSDDDLANFLAFYSKKMSTW